MFGLLAIVTCFYCCLRTGCCRLVWFGVVVAADLFSVALWLGWCLFWCVLGCLLLVVASCECVFIVFI